MYSLSKMVRLLVLLALCLTIGAVAAARARAASCDAAGADAATVASARAAVQGACDCAGAERATTWGRCVRTTLRGLLGSGLSRACERHVRRTELRSTCGRPQRNVCCRTNRHGKTTASLRRTGSCRASTGGSSCESVVYYLDDGCTDDGCVVPLCGNGVVEQGESCDPPNGNTCDDACLLCPPGGCPLPGQAVFCGDGPVTPQCSLSLQPQAACAAQGGCWDVTPFHPQGLCNCPTLDAGKTCLSENDCTGFCVAESDLFCSSHHSGKCTAKTFEFECLCLAGSPGVFYDICVD